MKHSNNKNWVIAILIIICCILISLIFVGVEDKALFSFISGFSTLLSIVLSILAIIYTFITGIESHRVNTNIEKEMVNIKRLIDILDSDVKHNEEIRIQTLTLSDQVEKTIEVIKADNANDENNDTINELEGLKFQIKAINQNLHEKLKNN